MILVNIHEAKAKLSEYIESALKGEHIVICKRNRPIVELRPIAILRTEPRPIGRGPHAFDVPESAFAPLTEEDLDEWNRGTVYPDLEPRGSRVAERPEAEYGDAPKRPPR